MLRRIDHVSIAVRDLDRARAFFLDVLGGREVYQQTLAGQGMRWTTVELGDSCLLELIDPADAEHSFLHRFFEQRGEGMHHITIQVDDARAFQEHLHARGVETFGFSEELEGWKEFFVHPRHAFGALLQFAQFEPLSWVWKERVPAPYLEFSGVPETAVRVSPEDPEVVELADGDATLRVPRAEVPALIRKLKAALG